MSGDGGSGRLGRQAAARTVVAADHRGALVDAAVVLCPLFLGHPHPMLVDLPLPRRAGVAMSGRTLQAQLGWPHRRGERAAVLGGEVARAAAGRQAVGCGRGVPRRGGAGEHIGGRGPLGDRHYDLILATDTLIYYGDLNRAFEAAASRLSPNGLLAVTLERMTEEEDLATGGHGWRLQGSGTYSHTTDHLHAAAAAAGLVVEHHDTEHSPRIEDGVPVNGHMAVLRLTKT